MKLPLDWLAQYVKTNKSKKEIAESFTSLGLMLDKPIMENVLDLEHRMDRSDWLSILGCARDFAAYENISLNYPKLCTKKGKPTDKATKVDIKVDCPDLVNRFNTLVFKNIKVKPSPEWLKNHLETYGIPSINNIVDITNYVMVEMGQPMHAQDLSKFQKREIHIRRAREGEELTTFLGETIKLTPEIFVLTQNDKPIVIGGIVGGAETGVTEATTEIVLDAGNYNQVNIRKTSRKLKILNETVMRYDKFLHPKLTELALQRATQLIIELAGGECYENVDWYPKQMPLKQMSLRYGRIKTISGMEIDTNTVERILMRLEYKILKKAKTEMLLEVPYFRTDVEVEDDLVADVLRINGYAKIPTTPIQGAPPKEITPEIYKFEDRLRNILVAIGLHEHITDPLVRAPDANSQEIIRISNALNAEKNSLRTSIYTTLLPVAEIYQKHKLPSAALFEVGKIYLAPTSTVRLVQVIYKAFDKNIKDNSLKVRGILDALMTNLNVADYHLENNAIKINGNKIGKIYHDGFKILTEELIKLVESSAPLGAKTRIAYEIPVTRSEDISFLLPTKTAIGLVIKHVRDLEKNVSDCVVIEEFKAPDSVSMRNVLLRLYFTESYNKSAILTDLVSMFDAELRK